MDARTFLGLEPTANPLRWRLPVTDGICSTHAQLFGGCGLAAAVVAAEAVTGRNTVWASAQYLRFAERGALLDLDVKVFVAGHRTTQARVVATTEGREILTVNMALGERPDPDERTLATFPEVPPPEACPVRQPRGAEMAGVQRRMEIRVAGSSPARPGTGRVNLWARVTDALDPSGAWLAVLGDLVPAGVADVRGESGGGNSLDNTLRLVRLVPSPWVLCEIGIDAVARGFAHGWCHLWATDGTLMATASQSVIVRSRRAQADAARVRQGAAFGATNPDDVLAPDDS